MSISLWYKEAQVIHINIKNLKDRQKEGYISTGLRRRWRSRTLEMKRVNV